VQIELTPAQNSFIDPGIQNGRFRDKQEAVRQRGLERLVRQCSVCCCSGKLDPAWTQSFGLHQFRKRYKLLLRSHSSTPQQFSRQKESPCPALL
jgi:hypothetical protein